MQRLQQLVRSINGQLKGLSVTSRMLIGSLMIILLMGLFLVSLYAGGRTMAPLGLGTNLGTDARAKVIRYLSERDIPYQESDGDVLVPVDRKYSVLANLNEQSLLAPDQINFEKLVTDDSPFRSNTQNRQRYLVAKMNVLATMISQMSGIERATVVIDQPDGLPGIGKAATAPSASVTVLPRAELGQAQVDAIARLVSGAHAGLKVNNVMVVDARSGRALTARSDDATDGSKYMDIKRSAENHVQQTLESALAYIPGVMIAVNAQVDARTVMQQKQVIEEPKTGVTKESTTTSSLTNGGTGGAPAVGANVGTSISTASANGPTKSEERNDTSSVPVFPTTTNQIKDSKGYAVQVNAFIGVPKSYFVRLYGDRQGDPTKTPDQPTLDALATSEITKMKSALEPLIDTGAVEGAVAGTLAINMVPDFSGPAAGSAGGTALSGPAIAGVADAGSAGSALGGLLGEGVVKYVSLGGLALVSLVMMAMMVRRAGVHHEMPSAAELIGVPPALAALEGDIVGEADEASPALEGVEINDDTLKRQQMLDQINEMITRAPGDAAHLVRKWARSNA